MKRFRILMASVVAVLMVAAVGSSVNGAGPSLKDKHVPDQVLVKFAEGTDAAAVASALSKHGLAKKGEIYGSDTLIVEGKGKTVSAMIDALSKQPGVEFVEPDYIATADWVPNDPYWSQQWGPYQTYADLAWDVTKGSSSVMIAVVDTGVDLNHPDLASKVRTDIDWNYVNNTGTAQDDNGHGTHVAGTAAAITNNGVGIAGMCPNCQILPVKVLNSAGSGSYSAIASGIRYAADKGAKVINLSLGGTAGSTELSSAVSYANGKGVLLACAAGNSNTSAASYPAYYTSCVAVAAVDSNLNRASFSNYGSWVDTSAPGVGIQATWWNDTYNSISGTSMATPHVAGLAGLLFSQGRTQSAVRTRLTSSTYTDPVNSTLIPRMINANKAVH